MSGGGRQRGRAKANVAGERYNSNALQMPEPNMPSAAASSNTQMSGGMPAAVMLQGSGTAGVVSPDLDFSKWKTIYPSYLDSKKTLVQGRRLAQKYCCEAPLVVEMAEVCRYLKIPCIIEPYKLYPKATLGETSGTGRCRIQLYKQDGSTLYHEENATRAMLMKTMGEMIPKLQMRQDRLKSEAAAAKAAAAASVASSAGGSKKKGKKGKKRR